MLRLSNKPGPRLALALLLAAGPGSVLGGCRQDNDPGPGGVTVGEARALDRAAEMLDAQAPQPSPAAPPSGG